jgi:hypothetical protein
MEPRDFYVFTYTRSVCGFPDSEAQVYVCTREEAMEHLEYLRMDDGPVYKGMWRCYLVGEEVHPDES